MSPAMLRFISESCFMALLLLRTNSDSWERIAVELNQLDKQEK